MSGASDIVAPALLRWRSDAVADDWKTVIVRIAFAEPPEDAAAQLAEIGARVESAGPGVVVSQVVPSVLERIAELPWVRAIEEPRELQLLQEGLPPEAGPSEPF